MKKILLRLILLSFAFFSFAQNSLPFKKGINMLTWFETWTENVLPDLNKYCEEDFAILKSMGVDIIRLPVHFDLVMEPAHTGKIMDIVLEKLDKVCDWAEKYQIYLVIDNHSFNSEKEDNDPPSEKLQVEHLKSVWSQVAPRYKNRSEYIIYEIINEPKGRGEVTPARWIKVQQELIDIIRSYDPERKIVVSGADFSSIDTLVRMKPYKDPNLIYTFHFYEPHEFTHQGATWVGPHMIDLEDIPFPYDRKRMPKLKGRAKDSYLPDYFREVYPTTGTVKYINNRIKKAADWAKKNNVRIWCGECGAKVWINPEDRISWIKATVSALNEYDIPYCTWGIDGSDGFLKADDRSSRFPEDIDKQAVEAYGFTMPQQKSNVKYQFPQKPFLVYDGLCGRGTGSNMWGNAKTVKVDDAHKYCISVNYPGIQNGCRLSLPKEVIDKAAEYKNVLYLSFSVKFTDSKQEFKVCFQNTDVSAELLPWRKSYIVKAQNYSINKWVTVTIPFSKFEEDYIWSDKLKKSYPPQGKFDWNRLESVYFDFDDFESKNTGDIFIDDVIIKK